MSYQVLARKYRPHTFDELVGQEQVSRALRHALDHNRLHHAYLFTGTRGVGKTTVARILARCLNCEEGISSTPCGTCSSCVAINEGRFFDLIEVDAASRTGIDDTRELLDNVQYAPSMGRYKVYLIDEVHMLSTSSFNALLKTLEEPPPHVKFLLATTDPQKLPVTVLSRCLQFNLKMLPADLIAEHLATLLNKEIINYDQPALTLLGRAAAGSMRDALSLTDQAIAFSDGELGESQVRAMLGSVDRDHVIKVLASLADAKPDGLLQTIDEIFQFHPDALSLLDDLISHLHQLAILQAVPKRGDARLRELAGQFRAEQIQLYYDIAVKGRPDLAQLPDGKSGLEMLLLRMLLFTPKGVLTEVPVTLTAESSTDAEAAPEDAPAKKPEPENRQPQAAAEQSGGAEEAAPQAPVEPEAVLVPETELAIAEDAANEMPEPPAAETPVAPETPEPVSISEPANTENISLDAFWYDLLPRLNMQGSTLGLAASSQLVAREDNNWQLAITEDQRILFNKERTGDIATALHDYFARDINIEWEFRETVANTPAIQAEQNRKAREAALHQSVTGDARVTNLRNTFDATLIESSIRPLQEETHHGF